MGQRTAADVQSPRRRFRRPSRRSTVPDRLRPRLLPSNL